MDRLDIQYRASQRQVAARTMKDLLEAWPTWEIGNIDSWERFAAAARGIIHRRAIEAAGLSTDYYHGKRMHALGLQSVPMATVPGEMPEPGRLDVSLLATGVGGTLRAIRWGMTPEAARQHGFVLLAKAAERHVLNAGRETLVRTSEADPEASGWMRHVEGTCPFCEARAGEGGGRFESHDGCQCSAEPVFVGAEPSMEPVSAGEAIAEYQGAGHAEINSTLRSGGTLTAEQQSVVSSLVQSAKPLSKDSEFFRGILYNNPAFDLVKNGRVGTVFHDLGFTSMTTDVSFADMVSGAATLGQGQAGYTLKVLVRKGSKMVQINDKLMHEFVALPGTRFRLVSPGPNPVIEVIL